LRSILIAVPFAVLATAIPVANDLWRSILKRDFQLTLQCLPGLWAALEFVLLLIAREAFGGIPTIFVQLGTPQANRAFMYALATVILIGLVKTVYQFIKSGASNQPLFSITSSLAMGLFVYGSVAHSNAILSSAEVFAVSGFIGIAEALWAAAKKRDAAYDSALGHSGPALVISTVIIGLAFIGM
jgi:hypothetical protein